MRGRPPKPTSVLVMTGAVQHDKKRYAGRAKEPKPSGPIGPPPAHFLISGSDGTKLADIWNELVQMAPPGALTISDRLQLELICELTLDSRRRGQKITVQRGVRAELSRQIALLGMNPSARSRMDVSPTGHSKEDLKDDLEEILGGGRKKA